MSELMDAFSAVTRAKVDLDMTPGWRRRLRRKREATFRRALSRANRLTGREPDDDSWLRQGEALAAQALAKEGKEQRG